MENLLPVAIRPLRGEVAEERIFSLAVSGLGRPFLTVALARSFATPPRQTANGQQLLAQGSKRVLVRQSQVDDSIGLEIRECAGQ
jgi:hypothetical protein